MLGPADVCGVGVGSGAGDVTELTAELVLDAAGRAAAASCVAGAAAAALRHLESRLLLLVLLAFQMLLVSLEKHRAISHTISLVFVRDTKDCVTVCAF